MDSFMLRIVQLTHPTNGRRIAIVEEPRVKLLSDYTSIYVAAMDAIASNKKLAPLVTSKVTAESLDYDAVYQGRSLWKLLPSFDHPTDPAHCFVMGTGL